MLILVVKKILLFTLIPLILSLGIIPVLPFSYAEGILCPAGEVEVVRVTNPNSICINQNTAERWENLGIAEIVGEPGKKVIEEVRDEPSPPQESSTQEHPNILFILTDNQAQAALGVYGNLDVKTPNIDRLASEGILFNNVFAANGMCSPTRATLMTGLLPSQHGVHNWLDDHNLEDWPENWSVVEEFRTLPLTLQNRGYDTAMIGKWHLGQPWESSIGYEHWVTFTYGHTLDFWNNNVIENGNQYDVKDKHIVDFFTDKAVEYIESHDGQNPFYLQLNYDVPYTLPPTNFGPAKNQFYSDYEGIEFQSMPHEPVHDQIISQISKPWNQTQWDLESSGEAQSTMNSMMWMIIQMQNDPESYANHLSQNAVVDDGVGRVLDALKENGLDENTLVVFSTDQGDLFGQHGHWGHTIMFSPAHLYDVGLNVPFIVRHTGTIEPNQVNDMMIGQYDLVPTIVDYLGYGDVNFENSPGRSFAPALKGINMSEWEEDVFFEQEETRGIRTNDFSYWKRISGLGDPELYDMQKDPGQTLNVYGNPDYANVVEELDQKLTEFFAQYADPKYDLWDGGTAKGTVQRPEMFKELYGNEWETISEELPKFSE